MGAYGGNQLCHDASGKRWRAVPEVSYISRPTLSAPEPPEILWRSLGASVARSQPDPNPTSTSTLSHYPPGIPPSLVEAQPCAGLSFLSVRRRSSTTGTFSQRRARATPDALQTALCTQ